MEQITTELRQWIVQEYGKGCDPLGLVKSMLASNWKPRLAVHAIQMALQIRFDGKDLSELFPLPRVSVHDHFLSADEQTELLKFYEHNVRWGYGWTSNKDMIATPSHWNHDFLNASISNTTDLSEQLVADTSLLPLAKLWNRLRSEQLFGHSLVRLYTNAHTYGVEGYPHTDSRLPGNYTTLFYINPQWQVEWAGETVFINDLSDITHSVLPRPGRGVSFDGRVLHCARGVTRLCRDLRVTLMFKTIAPNAQGVVGADDGLMSQGNLSTGEVI